MIQHAHTQVLLQVVAFRGDAIDLSGRLNPKYLSPNSSLAFAQISEELSGKNGILPIPPAGRSEERSDE